MSTHPTAPGPAALALLGAAGLAACLLTTGCERASEPQPARPGPEAAQAPPTAPAGEWTNVVLITIDTLRADALGAYTPGLATSPAIDRLAAEGVVFEQCVASSPSTLPSHSSIMTGKQPFAHGARSNHGYLLGDANRTLAEVLQEAGYATAAEISAPVIGRKLGLDQGFDEFRDTDSHGVRLKVAYRTLEGVTEPVEFPERHAVDISDKGIVFLRRNQNRPFFLWLHYFDPHQTYAAPREFASRFPENPYHAEVAFTDYAIGLLLDEMERLGLSERTLFVITSDHGEALGEHGEATHSLLVYDATMRVPLIVKGPGTVGRGLRVPELVRSVDIAPTILELLELEPLEEIQGVSLAPLVRGERRLAVPAGYGESVEAFTTFGTSILRFHREGPWKYIHKVNPELYQLERDPGELENLAESEPERTAQLRERLEELLREAPSAPGGAEMQADPELTAQLIALGYLGGAHAPEIESEAATFSVAGVDPNETVGDMLRFAQAFGLMNNLDRPLEAQKILVQLEEKYPDSVPILRARIANLAKLERPEEARRVAERALALAPQDVELQVNHLSALIAVEEYELAAQRALALIDLDPCHALAIAKLGFLLGREGRHADQGEMLRAAAERCDDANVKNEYAYFLASSPDPEQRDGARALALARAITANVASATPNHYDTLAAAYAETGDFARAVAIQREVLAQVRERDIERALLETFEAHLVEFEAGRAIRHE